MNVLFAMHFEAGHHMGTFRLARELRSRGHSVAYLGIPRLRSLVEEQGFRFVPFAEHLFSAAPSPGNPTARKSRQDRRRARAAEEALFRRYLDAIVDGTLDRRLRATNPDLLICDSFLWYVALRGLHLGIRTIQISTSLFWYDNTRIPPAITSISPRDTLLSRLHVLLAWKVMHLKFKFTKRLASRVFGAYRAPLRMHHLVGTFRRVARQSNFPCKRNVTYREDEIGAHLILPEIVLCPRSFQFPGTPPPERTFCGDFIDINRRESPLPANLNGKTVVLCSLGTSAASYPQAAHFFATVADASRHAPDWFFIMHVSDPALRHRHESTKNLLVADWVPQLSVLKHAAVMVSHGGLNSIMECVQTNVPMVLAPCARDQAGNAARAAYHQLALIAKHSTLDPGRFLELVASAMERPDLRAGLKRMKAAIEEEDGLRRAVELIEGLPRVHEEKTLDCVIQE